MTQGTYTFPFTPTSLQVIGNATVIGFGTITSVPPMTLEGRVLNVSVPNAVGTYQCDGGVAPRLSFQESRRVGSTTALDITYSSYNPSGTTALGPCTIVVTSYDGGEIRGTFEATAALPPRQSDPMGANDAGIQLFNGYFQTR